MMRLLSVTTGAALLLGLTVGAGPAAAAGPLGGNTGAPGGNTGATLQQALDALVAMPSGPPAVIAVVQRGGRRSVYRAGTADLAHPRPATMYDRVRIASVSKAFTGAVTLSLVGQGRLRLASTIGQVLPGFPRAWHRVTLRQLLQHRSGLPDYISSKRFQQEVARAPRRHLFPIQLLRFVWREPLLFRPGSRYLYDDSDNQVAAMMARAVTHRSYRSLLRGIVGGPAGLRRTTLPAGYRLPRPFLHGYEKLGGGPALDVSELLSASAAWASGGVVSTPADVNRFIRAYLEPRFFSRRVQAQQLRFVPGSSGPPGPGVNGAGLGIFRYRTSCGTVYGHTGNGPGYTSLAAASRDGASSLAVTATEQLNPRHNPAVFAALRQAETLAVCAALGHG